MRYLTEDRPTGVCLGCNTNFWWTGDNANVPPCGNCGRQHTNADFDRAKQSTTRKKRNAVTA